MEADSPLQRRGQRTSRPVTPLRRTIPGATVCASFALAHETLTLFGERTPTAIGAREDGQPLAGRMWIEYLRPGTRTWASFASSVVRDMGLGRAWDGTWIAFFTIAALVAIAGLASRLVLTEMRTR